MSNPLHIIALGAVIFMVMSGIVSLVMTYSPDSAGPVGLLVGLVVGMLISPIQHKGQDNERYEKETQAAIEEGLRQEVARMDKERDK